MATYSAAKTALVAFLRAGYTARTIYAEPTSDRTAADELNGWIDCAWYPGTKGPHGGRLGPNQTQYDTPFRFNLSILIPRSPGFDDAAWATAWATADALEALVLEAVVGDLTIETIKPLPQELEEGDSHVQIDLAVSGYLESVK